MDLGSNYPNVICGKLVRPSATISSAARDAIRWREYSRPRSMGLRGWRYSSAINMFIRHIRNGNRHNLPPKLDGLRNTDNASNCLKVYNQESCDVKVILGTEARLKIVNKAMITWA